MAAMIARVVSQKGTCSAGHRVGDEFVMGQKTPCDMCAWAFYVLFPFTQTLEFGGAFPWEKDPDRVVVACPDSENPVVFEVRRVTQ